MRRTLIYAARCSGTALASFGYDDADRRTSLTLPGSLAVAYGYDDASELLTLTYTRSGTIGDLAYSHDAAGSSEMSPATPLWSDC